MRKPLRSILGSLYLFFGYCSLQLSGLSAQVSQSEGHDAAAKVPQPNHRISEEMHLRNSGDFLRDIFQKYGQGDVMTLEGFKLLLKKLGIDDLDLSHGHLVDVHDKSHHHEGFAVPSTEEPHSYKMGSSNQNGGATQQERLQLIEKTLSNARRKCLSPSEILASSNQNPLKQEITPQRFLDLCPVIINEITQGHCGLSSNAFPRDEKMTEIRPRSEAPSKYVWFYSILAVLVISLSGMLSVAIVPIIRKYFYQKLLQFLVALAIGSLVGDALLHLLPHAMKAASRPHGELNGHEHADHVEGHGHGHGEVWLGLTALAGIGLFFCAEQLLNFLHGYKGRKDSKKKKIPPNYRVGEKLSMHTHGSYACPPEEETLQGLSNVDPCAAVDHHACYERPIRIDDSALVESTLPAPTKCLAINSEKQQNGAGKVKGTGACLNKDADESAVIIPHMHHGHHHSHGHRHAHDVPRTASATAWMVIAGDGFHNLIDGMAIGAAFTSSLTGGLSTTIAVFCHELPHELGDFALLLKAGMGTRQALLYNGLSSVLCFVGMLIGVAIGNIHSANSWVFAVAAGMFIYIALVDMMPELNCETGDCQLVKFVIQLLGMSIGATIMCLIALFEHDLQDLIEDGS